MSDSPTRDTFDEEAYRALHPDVAAAVDAGVVGSGWQHFQLHGQREGRRWVAMSHRLEGVVRTVATDDEMSSGNAEHYFDVGESAMRRVADAVRAAGLRPERIRRILDLPCGHGRVLRFLRAAYPHAEIVACDLNASGVAFCAREFGAVPVLSEVEVENVDLSGGFDLIWCGSLLTHLPLSRGERFARWFARQLSPGGVWVGTFHGRRCEESLASGRRTVDLDAASTRELLVQVGATGCGYVDYRDQAGYGFSLFRADLARARLGACGEWDEVFFRPQGWDDRQDVIAFRRRTELSGGLEQATAFPCAGSRLAEPR